MKERIKILFKKKKEKKSQIRIIQFFHGLAFISIPCFFRFESNVWGQGDWYLLYLWYVCNRWHEVGAVWKL